MESNFAQPIRQFIVHIRSKDVNVEGDLNSHIFIDLVEPIKINPKEEEIHLVMTQAEIPNSFYNVSSNVNNDKLLYNSSVSYTIPNKNYDIDELVRVLNADDGFPVAITYDKFTGKTTLTNNSGSTITLNWSGSTCGKLLGFGFGDIIPDSVIANGDSVESTNIADLASVHSLLIKSTTSGNMVFSTRGGYSQVIQKISVDVNSGFIIYLNQNDARQHTILHSNIDALELRIEDQNNNLINFNGINYELSISFMVFPINRTIQEIERKVNIRSRRNDIQGQIIPQETNRLAPFQTPSIIVRQQPIEPVEQNEESEIEHKGKKLIIDQIIDMMDKS